MSKYFVMVHRQDGSGVLPLVEEETGEVCIFDEMDLAMDAANENDMALCFGFDVFQMGCGVDGSGGIQ